MKHTAIYIVLCIGRIQVSSELSFPVRTLRTGSVADGGGGVVRGLIKHPPPLAEVRIRGLSF